MIERIDQKFFESTLDFGKVNGKKRAPRSMCITFQSKVFLATTPEGKLKSGEKPNLKACSRILNLCIDRLAKMEESIPDEKIVRFFENMEHLNQKMTVWNDKIMKSNGVLILDIFLRIITLNLYRYRSRKIANPLRYEQIRVQYNQAKARIVKQYNITQALHSQVSTKFNEYMESAKKYVKENGWRYARDIVLCQLATFFGVPGIVIDVALFAVDFFLP